MSQSKSQSSQSLPEYIRMPKVGEKEPISKLSRSSIDRVVRPQKCNNFKPPVVSRCVRIQGGARRGTRLILLSSLLDFIDQQPKQLKSLPRPSAYVKIRHQQARYQSGPLRQGRGTVAIKGTGTTLPGSCVNEKQQALQTGAGAALEANPGATIKKIHC
jgi:hypothetical protein